MNLLTTTREHENTQRKTTGQFEHVEGLRGLAALVVVIYHVWIACGNALPADDPLWWNPLSRGYIGVHLFLVVSGFCVCWPYIGKGQAMRLGQFAVRRALRLMPPYLVALAIFSFVALVCNHENWLWPTSQVNTKTWSCCTTLFPPTSLRSIPRSGRWRSKRSSTSLCRCC